MESEEKAAYVVHITPTGNAGFRWVIFRTADSTEVSSSSRAFPTRLGALLDSARAAAMLNIAAVPSDAGEEDSRG